MKSCLHLLPGTVWGGAEKMALTICNNIKEYKTIVICGSKVIQHEFEKKEIESYKYQFSLKYLTISLRKIKEIILYNDIKIIHAHDNKASIYAYLIKKIYRLDIKIISHIHSCYPFLKKNSVNKLIDLIFRPKYNYNIACGTQVYDYYKSNTKYLLKEKTIILSNAIDINEIENSKVNKDIKILDKYNISQNNLVIGFVGRLEESKGIIPFIDEVYKNKNKFSNCKFMIIGTGTLEEKIKQLIKILQLEDLFVLTGFSNDIYEYYPIIDIFVLPSIYEGLPMVILEAMAFKKIVVSMNVGSVNEVIKHNQNGYLIEAGNYESFIKTLVDIKNNKINLEKIRESAYSFVCEKYSIDKYVKDLTCIYE